MAAILFVALPRMANAEYVDGYTWHYCLDSEMRDNH